MYGWLENSKKNSVSSLENALSNQIKIRVLGLQEKNVVTKMHQV